MTEITRMSLRNVHLLWRPKAVASCYCYSCLPSARFISLVLLLVGFSYISVQREQTCSHLPKIFLDNVLSPLCTLPRLGISNKS